MRYAGAGNSLRRRLGGAPGYSVGAGRRPIDGVDECDGAQRAARRPIGREQRHAVRPRALEPDGLYAGSGQLGDEHCSCRCGRLSSESLPPVPSTRSASRRRPVPWLTSAPPMPVVEIVTRTSLDSDRDGDSARPRVLRDVGEGFRSRRSTQLPRERGAVGRPRPSARRAGSPGRTAPAAPPARRPSARAGGRPVRSRATRLGSRVAPLRPVRTREGLAAPLRARLREQRLDARESMPDPGAKVVSRSIVVRRRLRQCASSTLRIRGHRAWTSACSARSRRRSGRPMRRLDERRLLGAAASWISTATGWLSSAIRSPRDPRRAPAAPPPALVVDVALLLGIGCPSTSERS